jgi:hypothetical protein
VYVANLRNGTWQTEVVATNGAAVQSGLSAVQDSRLHLALARTGTGASYAFRTANLDLDDDPTPPNEPPQQTDGGYNALDPCVEDHSSGNGLGAASAAHTAAAATAHTLAPAGGLDDGQIFGAMHTVFAATAAGQSYMDRYHEHGAEMAQIGLDDHDLLWDAYGTLQNFMPGLEALVTGRGSEVVVTQAMVDDALDIWQRLAAAASPALAADINAELALYNDLQDFVDMSFDEWAKAIGVQPPTVIFLPSVYR